MDLKFFWDIFIIFQVPKKIFGSCRNFYRPVLNPQTPSFLWKCGFSGAENDKNGSWDKKSIFSKSKISIHQSNHGKRNIKPMLFRAEKRFRTTCGVSEIIAKFRILPSQITFLWDFSREVYFGRAKIENFELSQGQRKWSWNVLKAKITSVWCFFLRGWIGVSISWTLKKFNFLSHEQFLAFSAQPFWSQILQLNLWSLCVFS